MHNFIIIGAGSAGCVLANRLSASGQHNVLLVEAGGPDKHPLLHMPVGFLKALQRPEFTWGYMSEPEPALNGRRIPVPRGRVLGGSSSVNGMFHIRGARIDFDEWAKPVAQGGWGCDGWAYDEVLPYFKRSESHGLFGSASKSYHGHSGPLCINPIHNGHLLAEPLRQAAMAAGHADNPDYDGEVIDGYNPGMVAIDTRGRRSSSATAYLRPAEGRPNLQVLTGALTQRILFEGEGANLRAVGVEVLVNGQSKSFHADREVILCGGAYGSPQLLMCSGIGPGANLQALGIGVQRDLPGVGQNLIEHPRMMLQYRAKPGVPTFVQQLRLDRATLSAINWALRGKGPFATHVTSGTILLRTRPELDRPDVQLLCNPVRLDAGLWFPGFKKPQEPSFYVTVCLLHQKSRGRVSLQSARVQDAPRIAFKLFSHPDDLATTRAALRAARHIYAQKPMADLIEAETIPGADVKSDDALDAQIRALGGITHHPVGTCAMGLDAQSGAVVDARLRVHGVAGLRVADASIMPSMPSGNTNAGTVMIGEKAADMILQDNLK